MGVNMIKPEDTFNLFCRCFSVSHTLTIEEKYRTQKWRLGKYYFYMSMYDKNSIYNTTYYAELM